MNNKNEKLIKFKKLETRLKEIDKDLSTGYSVGKQLARVKIQEKLDHARSDLYFHE